LSFARDKDEQWLLIDLGAKYSVSTFEISFFEHVSSYEILVSTDGTNYTRVYRLDGGASQTKQVDTIKLNAPVDARYVKYVQLKRNYVPSWNAYYSGGILEFRVSSFNEAAYTKVIAEAKAFLAEVGNSDFRYDGVFRLSNELENYLKQDTLFSTNLNYYVTEINRYMTMTEAPDGSSIPTNVALYKNYEATLLDTTYTASLTDGVAANKLTYDNNWFVFKNNPAAEQPLGGGNAPYRVGRVVIDLDGKYDLSEIRINLVQNDVSGINIPASITVYLSEDGESWDNGQSLDIPEANTVPTNEAFKLIDSVSGTASYVKLEIALGAKSFVFLNEIEVFGVKAKEITPDPDPEYTLGDVNNDGAINQYDYILVKRHYFGTRILTDVEMLPADVNTDEKVDQYDYILICRHYFGTYEIKN
ncbi:MAG: discoidin domain-containing protein, partial [Clostridia bacterium]|nr:discoidin domain-containing protein [Clostridia bacterium]